MTTEILLRYFLWAGYLGFAGLVTFDAVRTSEYGRTGVVLMLAALTLWFFVSFGEAVKREGSLRIESHWGGLGGGVGGFRISPSLLYLAGAICFGGLSVLAYYPLQNAKTEASTAQTPQQTTDTKPVGAKSVDTKPAETKGTELKANPGRK